MIQDLNTTILIIRIGIVSKGHSLIIRNNTCERSGSFYVTLGLLDEIRPEDLLYRPFTHLGEFCGTVSQNEITKDV